MRSASYFMTVEDVLCSFGGPCQSFAHRLLGSCRVKLPWALQPAECKGCRKLVRSTGSARPIEAHRVGSAISWRSRGPRARTGLCGRSYELLSTDSWEAKIQWRKLQECHNNFIWQQRPHHGIEVAAQRYIARPHMYNVWEGQ